MLHACVRKLDVTDTVQKSLKTKRCQRRRMCDGVTTTRLILLEMAWMVVGCRRLVRLYSNPLVYNILGSCPCVVTGSKIFIVH